MGLQNNSARGTHTKPTRFPYLKKRCADFVPPLLDTSLQRPGIPFLVLDPFPSCFPLSLLPPQSLYLSTFSRL
jgi:hypothetical protein